MEEKKIPNPKAFPNTDGQTFCEDGMTLRDYFAARVMPEIMRQYNGTKKEIYDFDAEELETISFYSYQVADAMLNQRTKQ